MTMEIVRNNDSSLNVISISNVKYYIYTVHNSELYQNMSTQQDEKYIERLNRIQSIFNKISFILI